MPWKLRSARLQPYPASHSRCSSKSQPPAQEAAWQSSDDKVALLQYFNLTW